MELWHGPIVGGDFDVTPRFGDSASARAAAILEDPSLLPWSVHQPSLVAMADSAASWIPFVLYFNGPSGEVKPLRVTLHTDSFLRDVVAAHIQQNPSLDVFAPGRGDPTAASGDELALADLETVDVLAAELGEGVAVAIQLAPRVAVLAPSLAAVGDDSTKAKNINSEAPTEAQDTPQLSTCDKEQRNRAVVARLRQSLPSDTVHPAVESSADAEKPNRGKEEAEAAEPAPPRDEVATWITSIAHAETSQQVDSGVDAVIGEAATVAPPQQVARECTLALLIDALAASPNLLTADANDATSSLAAEMAAVGWLDGLQTLVSLLTSAAKGATPIIDKTDA